MIRSLYSSVAGLKVHQTRMDVIGNNIANVNSNGFKASRTSFADIYYQAARTEAGGNATFAGNNSAQVGYGSLVASIDKDMSQSNLQTTNRTLDVAITGDGMFVVSSKDRDGKITNVKYTRNGQFGIDSVGNLVNSHNQFVLGRINRSRVEGGTYAERIMDGLDPGETPQDMDGININDLVWDAFKPETEQDYDDVKDAYKTPDEGVEGVANDGTQHKGYNINVTVFQGKDPYNDTRTIAYDNTIIRLTNNAMYKDDSTQAVTPVYVNIPPVNTTGEYGKLYTFDGTNYTEQTDPYAVDIKNDLYVWTKDTAPTTLTAGTPGFKKLGTEPFFDKNGVVQVPDTRLTNDNIVSGSKVAFKLLKDDAVMRQIYSNYLDAQLGKTLPAGAEIYNPSETYQVYSDYILYSVNGKYVNGQGVEYDPKVGYYKDKDGQYYRYECITSVDEDGKIQKRHNYYLQDSEVSVNGITTFKDRGTDDAVFTYNGINKTWEGTDARGNTIYADFEDNALHYDDLDSFNISANGMITAKYSKDVLALCRLDLATFINIEGLNEAGDTEFIETTASGKANIKRPGENGAGTTVGNRVETSNVNLADEFSDMIVTQRGFQANARVITTSDSMLEELVNLKR